MSIEVPDDSPEDASACAEPEVAWGPCRNQYPTETKHVRTFISVIIFSLLLVICSKIDGQDHGVKDSLSGDPVGG